MNSPVAFIIFNRPDLTAQVFARIRAAAPPRLYVIADGPRNEAEALLTAQTRAVAEQVDWPCSLVTLYSEENLGCRKRVISGLNEVFAREEQAIILEDDCLPHPDFFLYCDYLLHTLRDNPAVGTINGTAFPGFDAAAAGNPYVYSRFSIIWGWATWRRVWQLTALGMQDWEQKRKERWPKKLFPQDPHIAYGITAMFNQMLTPYDAWSYILLYNLMKNGLLNIHPVENLISNTGFDARATHTHQPKPYSNLPLSPNGWQAAAPYSIGPNIAADRLVYETLYYWHTRKKTLREKVTRGVYNRLYKMKQWLLPGISLKQLVNRKRPVT